MVATDYFTKWAEAKVYAQIKANHLTQFAQRNIICRFGVPHSIISDNGPQFISKSFQQFCAEYGIKNVFSTPRFPQSNGQVEVTSKTLLGYLKRKLTSAKGKWVDKLPITLWAYRSIPKQLTEETPYALAFGIEALIPVEFGLETLCTSDTSLDELEEKSDRATIRMVKYHHQTFHQREKIIKPRAFSKGDLILRRTVEEGKLKPNWEGPFIIADNGSKGAYRIQSQYGKIEAHP